MTYGFSLEIVTHNFFPFSKERQAKDVIRNDIESRIVLGSIFYFQINPYDFCDRQEPENTVQGDDIRTPFSTNDQFSENK